MLLVTAGFDSAIQVHLLTNMCKDSSEADGRSADSNDSSENFSLCTPNVSEKFELMDRYLFKHYFGFPVFVKISFLLVVDIVKIVSFQIILRY